MQSSGWFSLMLCFNAAATACYVNNEFKMSISNVLADQISGIFFTRFDAFE